MLDPRTMMPGTLLEYRGVHAVYLLYPDGSLDVVGPQIVGPLLHVLTVRKSSRLFCIYFIHRSGRLVLDYFTPETFDESFRLVSDIVLAEG